MFVTKAHREMIEAHSALAVEAAELRAENERMRNELEQYRRAEAERALGEKLLAKQFDNLFSYTGDPQEPGKDGAV